MKKALITGITGQDGSYLAELLLDKGYQVHGIIRRSSNFNTQRIDHIYKDQHINDNLVLHFGDLTDSSLVDRLMREIQPDEIYNLGAQSHVRVSFEMPEYTSDVVAMGTLRMLEAMRNYKPDAKFYQASSSEMFGDVRETPQTETTPFYPRSPYGVAKVFAYWMTVNYREAYDLHAGNGILFNHESPRRGRTFVTRKVTRGLSRIKLGLDKTLFLGNLDSKRDWGHAKDYVEAMWLMLQQEKADDYVIATGETHSIRKLVEITAKNLDFDLEWQGEGLNEVGIDKKSGKTIVKIDSQYFRPTEVDLLLGDPGKAKKTLKWEPKYTFESMIDEMTEFDLANEESKEHYY